MQSGHFCEMAHLRQLGGVVCLPNDCQHKLMIMIWVREVGKKGHHLIVGRLLPKVLLHGCRARISVRAFNAGVPLLWMVAIENGSLSLCGSPIARNFTRMLCQYLLLDTKWAA